MSGAPSGSEGGAPRLGSMFGRYRIEAVVGRGGMGVVVRATDTKLLRPVALKFVAPELVGDPLVRERFVRESRLAAAIESPNIVPIYEAGEAEGTLFIAMRAIPGPDLATVLRREAPLGVERTLAIVEPIAVALDTAHRRGLIHRDVKPANVLLEPGEAGGPERPWLTDFGLTRSLGDPSDLTVGGPLGTIDYLAPELIDGGAIGPWTDQYALACLIVHSLTGAPPWQGPTDAAILYHHVHADRATLVERMGDERLAAVLAKGLARDGADRYVDCRSLAQALAAAAVPVSLPAIPAVVASAAVVDSAAEDPPAMAGAHRVTEARVAAAGRDDAETDPLVTRDERATGPADATSSASLPAKTRPGRRPGRRDVAVVVGSAVLLAVGGLLAASGGSRVVAPSPPPTSAGVSPTPIAAVGAEEMIVFAGGEPGDWDLWAIRPDGTGLSRLKEIKGFERWPDVTRDGRTIVFTRGTLPDRDLWQIQSDGTGLTQLTFSDGDDREGAISPDGRWLVWASNRDSTYDLWMMEDTGEGFDERTAVNLTAEPRSAWNHQEYAPAWHPDGDWFAFSSNELDSSDIWRMDPDRPRAARPLTDDPILWADGAPTVAPDGLVAFIGQRGHFDRDIYTVRHGADPVRLTTFSDHVTAPDLSPDGERIVAVLGTLVDIYTPTETRLLVIDAASGERIRSLPTGLTVAADPRWTPLLVTGSPEVSATVAPTPQG